MGLLSWLFGKRRTTTVRDDARSSTDGVSSSGVVVSYRRAGKAVVNQAVVKWREGSFPLDVVGESNYQDALVEICGGHNRHGQDLKVWAEIKREPTNPHDKNAVAVSIEARKVGYLSREQAQRISSQMQEDGIERARCEAKIVGGWRTNQYDSAYFGVKLGIPTWGWVDFGLGKQAPAPEAKPQNSKKQRPEAASSGPLVGEYVVVWGGGTEKNGEVAQELANLGANIMAGVGKSTTMVVHVEDELTPGALGSATYKKAKAQIDLGSTLEVISLKKLRQRLKDS